MFHISSIRFLFLKGEMHQELILQMKDQGPIIAWISQSFANVPSVE